MREIRGDAGQLRMDVGAESKIRGQASLPQLRGCRFVRFAWVDWVSHRWQLKPIGSLRPTEGEERYRAMISEPALAT